MGTMLILLVLLPAAEPADDAKLALQVRKLVAELDAPTLAAREQAQRELTGLGQSALPLLPKETGRLSLEQRTRVAAVRLAIESAAAESTAAGTKVTLSGADLPLAEVLAAIEKQTGNKLVDYREKFGQDTEAKKVSVNFSDTPFWQAMDQVLAQAGLGVYAYSGEPGLAIVARAGGPDRTKGAVYRGAFRLEPLRLEARRDLRNPQTDGLKVAVEIGWEPRSAPIALVQKLESLSAVDENGAPLEVDGRHGQLEANVQPGSSGSELELPFKAPPRTVAKLGSIKGKLSVLLPGPPGVFRFEKLAAAQDVQQQQGRATVTLEKVRDVGEGSWQAVIRVRYEDPGQALESHRGWIYQNPAYLVGPDGQKIEGGMETTGQTETEVGVAYLFFTGGGIEGYTFVYETPTAVIADEVEFELKDLPLP
ncbi:MAG: hypothetical protein U0836_16035 [Pirellulales bacterium]